MRTKPASVLILILTFVSALMLDTLHARADYLTPVKAYAETMIEHGRDKYGEVKSPLFAAALDRSTLEISPDFPEIPGVRGKDRSLTGSNPDTEQGLYHLLYALTEITGDRKYAEEADNTLQFFFENCQNKHGFMAWGEHVFWDFNMEKPNGAGRRLYHEPGGWGLRDQSARLAPDAYYKYALALWKCQIGNKETGDFTRHANFSRGQGGQGAAYPRLAGQMIEIWAHAYGHPELQDKEERDLLIKAIETITKRMRTNREAVGDAKVLPYANPYSVRGGIKKGRTYDPAPGAWLYSNLELARGLLSGAEHVPAPLGQLMTEVAITQHEDFLRQPHYEDGNEILSEVSTGISEKYDKQLEKARKEKRKGGMWFAAYGSGGSFSGGMTKRMAIAYKDIKDIRPDLAKQYEELLIKDSKKFLEEAPDLEKAREIAIKPSVYATLINIMLHMHEMTGQREYLERAEFFAGQGVELFLGGISGPGSALPKSSTQTDHYESITGGPGFMWALLQLHQRL